MPTDLDMLLSAGPPLFSGGSNVSECRLSACVLPPQRALFNPRIAKNGFRRASTNVPPIKPCMSPRDEEIQSEPTSPTGRGKQRRVSFADDRGLALTEVRVMVEPSDCPPRWSDEFVAHITRADVQPDPGPTWEATFTQPASDYLTFRHQLESNCVCLENVIVRNQENSLTGTIKVKNVSFEKEVFVRVTFDAWKTQQDYAASYVPNGHLAAFFDTFAFSVPIPSQHGGTVEMCACFRHNGTEHWDSNGGKNYRLLCKNVPPQAPQPVRRFTDPLRAEVDSWTEFASWRNLITEGPYW
ncbi:protein phosphatase 1 regulatory subunit 3B-like [Ornithodoros turicata]|uniref:protein phosphatase 1 regulatory subunit 3B-like n=1 Tax=Ornithodoros turicata TaxID=34597 RepID=UPI00313A3974